MRFILFQATLCALAAALGMGDIPLAQNRYDTVTAAGYEVAHFPFVVGSISIFHSIPGKSTRSAYRKRRVAMDPIAVSTIDCVA